MISLVIYEDSGIDIFSEFIGHNCMELNLDPGQVNGFWSHINVETILV